MEAQRPSLTIQKQSTLDDRLNSLVGSVDDESELPPLPEPEQVKAEPAAPEPEVVATPEPEVRSSSKAEAAPEKQVSPEAHASVNLVPRQITNLTPGEKRDMSMQAELYSILMTMEHLEQGFVKGVISNEDYEKHCKQIVTQFKTLQKALAKQVPDIKVFMSENDMRCDLAEERLLGTGVAATALLGTGGGKELVAVQTATENFITFQNALQLNYTSVAELMPILHELQTSIVAIPHLPPSVQGLERITTWLVTLNNMHASESISEQQLQQLTLDADIAYTSFKKYVQSH